jgi:hypothetical protein
MVGFDLGLLYATDVTESSMRKEIARIVSDHDHPDNDLVILSLGAPIGSGWKFPSSSLLADLAFNDPQLPDALHVNHSRNVLLYDVDSNRVR